MPAVQVRCWQGVSVPGHSEGVVHDEPPVPEEVVAPMVPLVVEPAPPLELPASEMSMTTEVQPKGAATNRVGSPARTQSGVVTRIESLSPICSLGRIAVSVNQNFATNEQDASFEHDRSLGMVEAGPCQHERP
jgi:hypothetical protein